MEEDRGEEEWAKDRTKGEEKEECRTFLSILRKILHSQRYYKANVNFGDYQNQKKFKSSPEYSCMELPFDKAYIF